MNKQTITKKELKTIFIIAGIIVATISYLLKITILTLVLGGVLTPTESTFIYVINELTNSTMYIAGGVAYAVGIKIKKGGKNGND